jgi:hypothetical protein
MTYSVARVCLVALTLTAAVGCTKSPAQPSTADATIVAPVPSLPANNSQVRNADQPIALVVTNAVSTKAGLTYTFEVATDVAFASKVQTKESIPEGTNGQTSVRLDSLAPGRDYYWRARASAGGATAGAFGIASRFALGSVINVNTPVPIGPLTSAQTAQRPALRVVNAGRSGPTGAVTYTFEIASIAAFTTIIASGTVPEGVNETGFIPSADLPMGTPLFWRATANDASNATSSEASPVQSFTVIASQAGLIALQRGVVLWPGVQPPGIEGRARMGPGWDVKTIRDFLGQLVPSPTLEHLRVFDLLDRGMDPDSAIAWMNANGYFTASVYYASVQAIGFQSHYMALVFGAWELVIRVGA